MMKKERLRYLIDVSNQRNATAKERRELNAWYASFEQDPGYTDQLDAAERDKLRNRMLSAFEMEHFRKRWWQHWRYSTMAAAAMIALAVATGLWLYTMHPDKPLRVAAETPIDLLPGGNKATLTLADGQTIDLSEAQTGIIVGDGIRYLDGSAVVGEQGSVRASEQVQRSERNHKFTSSPVHSLTTPKGGQYQITLPDGTKVWLNAASTLKYPSRFSGNERVVELEGEAYFDVSEQVHRLPNSQVHKLTSSQKIPFKVVSNGQVVEVVGTQFNISAYPDEHHTKTTLVEGSVRVKPTTEHQPPITLMPGEQGVLEAGTLSKQPASISTATAWKNGDFMFDNEPLESIMKKLARWYDAEIVYEGAPENLRLYGMVSRSKNISTVLEVMEMTEKVKFRIEAPKTGRSERRIVVMQ